MPKWYTIEVLNSNLSRIWKGRFCPKLPNGEHVLEAFALWPDAWAISFDGLDMYRETIKPEAIAKARHDINAVIKALIAKRKTS